MPLIVNRAKTQPEQPVNVHAEVLRALYSPGYSAFQIAIIPLTHHKNSGYTELKVLGVYFSPAAGGGKIYNAQLSFCLPHFKLVC